MASFGDAELFEEFEGDDKSEISGIESDSSEDDVSVAKYRELVHENERLKRALKYFSRPANIRIKDSIRDGPVAHLLLFNNIMSRKYHEEIQNFFYELCNRRLKSGEYDMITDIQPTYIQYSSPGNEVKRKKSSRRAEAAKKAFQSFSSIQLYDKFSIDQVGQPLYFQDPKHSEWSIPDYHSVEFGPLMGELDGATTTRKRLQRICFNCGGTDHQIKDCEQPRDHRAISQRRKKFMDECSRAGGGSPQIRIDSRYHKEDDGEDSKERFANFKPGMISDALQEALGMKEDDLPPYIYKMRRLGYPPGHLLNAQIVDSGLSLYEEGEINGRLQPNKYVPVDVDKLIGYPGFNIPPLPGQVDKYKEYKVLPMDHSHSHENLVSYYERRNSIYYRQKATDAEKEKEKEANAPDDADVVEVDMEMGNDDDTEEIVCIDDNAKYGPEEGEMEDSNEVKAEVLEGEMGDLTADELEVKRELLLKQLQQDAASSRDSDYRDIETKDQDYRMIDEVITIEDSGDSASDNPIIIKDSPDSPLPEDTAEETSYADTDIRDIEHKVQEDQTDFQGDGAPNRNLSSDTDYRLHHPVVDSPATSIDSSTEQKNSLESTPKPSGDDNERRLPDREKFADGISKFDRYYEESKPQGMYKKLRILLKDSPRRQEK